LFDVARLNDLDRTVGGHNTQGPICLQAVSNALDLTAANFIGWNSLSAVGPLSVFSPAGGGGVTRRFQVSAPAGSPSALSLYTASQAEILRLSNSGASWFTGGLLGLGTVTPSATLDVNGSFRFFNPASPPVAGYVLGTDGEGNASWQPPAAEVVSPPAEEGGSETGMIVITSEEQPPECGKETRSRFLFIKAESGTQDGLQICTKDADDQYAWRVVQVFNL
jgi:hypothetical protein